MIPKTYIFLIFIGIFTSCNYRVYTNGKYDYTINHSEVNWKSQTDSILVLSANDSVPNGAILINNTQVLCPDPMFFIRQHSPYSLTISIAKDEAKRIGANVIRIELNHRSNPNNLSVSERYELYTQMYALKEPFLSDYKKTIDSLNQVSEELNKNFCIVHITDASYPYAFDGQYPVYFNDSIVGYLKRNSHTTSLNLKFDKEGVLFIGWRKNPTKSYLEYVKSKGVYLNKDKEYYMYVSGPFKTSEYKFTLVKKFEYENNVLEN